MVVHCRVGQPFLYVYINKTFEIYEKNTVVNFNYMKAPWTIFFLNTEKPVSQ